MNLNYYKIPSTHKINFLARGFLGQGYVLCPDIIKSNFITPLKNVESEKPIYKPWSYKYEFIPIFNNFFNRIKLDNVNNYKTINENNKCPFCDSKIQNKNEMKQIYFIPEINYCFSPFIIHMIKIHDYKPPEKFIEYILSTTDNEYKFLKLGEEVASFFKNFVNYNMNNNFKFIDKNLGNLEQDDDGKNINFYGKPGYKELFLPPTNNRVIQEFNKRLSKEYIDSEIGGSFDIKNIENTENKFYKIKKIIILNRIDNKQLQIDNGRGPTKTYFFHYVNRYKFIYHIHPDYISSGSENIIKRIIRTNILFEFFSYSDILAFFEALKQLDGNVCSSLIFTQEGIYYYMPKLGSNPFNITTEQIKNVCEKISEYFNELNKLYKFYFVHENIDGLFEKNEDYHSIIYHEHLIFKYLKNKLAELDLDLIFYPKEIKEDGSWGYGNIYIPFMPDYKNKLKNLIKNPPPPQGSPPSFVPPPPQGSPPSFVPISPIFFQPPEPKIIQPLIPKMTKGH